jgi:hypothetical protein
MGPEQRSPYVGTPPRCAALLQLVQDDGDTVQLTLLADTGSPCALIVGTGHALRFKRSDAPNLRSNFGLLRGVWFRVAMPDLGFDRFVLGYSSDGVVAAAQASSLSLEGLVGLPLLRMLEFGGDEQFFWLRMAGSQP